MKLGIAGNGAWIRQLHLNRMKLLETSLVLGARDREHHEGVADGGRAQGIDRYPITGAGEALEVRREGSPVGKLPIGPDIVPEMLQGRRDGLSRKRRRQENHGDQGRAESANQ